MIALRGKRARRHLFEEGGRYALASGMAFAVDFGTYVALIRLLSVHYLVAAPCGFALGLATIYLVCVHWVFASRRLGDARLEFAIFTSIGLAGMALNQLVIYAGVDRLSFSYEVAKVAAAAIVFGFNFALRKRLLFTGA